MAKYFEAGIVSASLTLVLGSIGKLAVKEIGKILNVDTQLRKLKRTLLKMLAMIDTLELDYASYPITNISCKELWDSWLEEVKNVVYDVDDLFEEISVELGLDRGGDSKVRDELLSNFKVNVPRVIDAHVQELENLALEMDYFFKMGVVKLAMPKLFGKEICSFGVSTSVVDVSLILGRGDLKSKVLPMLFSESLSVIPITGMGGIGKTTFAQLLFNDKQVVDTFRLRIWVSLPLEFDLIRTTRSIIESALKKTCKLTELEPLQSMLQELLRAQKFLLVLDGFWSEESGDWDNLSAPFKVGSKGSKIIITTRSEKVSLAVGAEPFHLPTLSDEDCWKLVKQRAHFNEQMHQERISEQVGLEIAKKCRGLPLAAKMLGGLLHCIPDEWDSILKSQLWDLPQYEKNVFPVLLISYYSLTPHLKRCFSYCAVFPHDYVFEVDKLVQMWVAEGLVQPIGGRRLEDIGKEFFKDLLSRSFFYRSHGDPHVPKKIYKMHDFIHNMAQQVSMNVCHRMEDMSSYCYPLLESFRHLSVCPDSVQSVQLEQFPKCNKLRTFLLLCGGGGIGQQVNSLLKKFRIIKVLDLSSGGIIDLTESIGCLTHLRYLNLSGNGIPKLPQTVVKLSCLETLVLNDCPQLDGLPHDFNNLTTLRHLEFDVKQRLDRMPIKLGKLVNLQTLYAFIVFEGEGYGIGELKDMRYLGGSLCITRLENVLSKNAAESASLNMKPWIEKLVLEWTTCGDNSIQSEALTGLEPHENLKELSITNYSGNSFPPWIFDRQSRKLNVIHLKGCRDCVTLPHFGQLQFLEHLVIENMFTLETIDSHFFGHGDFVRFQSLKSLKFVDMPQLTRWEYLRDLDMPRLCDLKFYDCPKLISLPPVYKLNSLKNLEIKGCKELGCLPEEGLPDSIQTVIIQNCPILKVRCRFGGEDWWKVKRVPMIEIDGEGMSTASMGA